MEQSRCAKCGTAIHQVPNGIKGRRPVWVHDDPGDRYGDEGVHMAAPAKLTTRRPLSNRQDTPKR